jgi:hypothetical protein
MWWRMTKTIIISWFIGVVCGAVMIVAIERNQTAPTIDAGNQSASQTTGSGASADSKTQ